MSLASKTSFLEFIARTNPKIYDVLYPHGPKISTGTRNLMASMLVKAIARELPDSKSVKELKRVGQTLFENGKKSMSYEDDDWCPTWPKTNIPRIFWPDPSPWPWLRGVDEIMLNPQPLPPREPIYYGALITQLAEVVSIGNTAEILRIIGSSLMKQSSEILSDISSFSNIENGK